MRFSNSKFTLGLANIFSYDTEEEELKEVCLENKKKFPGSRLLIEHVTSLEKLSGEWCQEESPNLKSSFTAAHILVGSGQRVYKFRCFGR